MAAKKLCKSKATGKRVSCAKQRAGRKGAKAAGFGKSRASGRRAPKSKVCIGVEGKRVSCKRQRAAKKAARTRRRGY